MRERPRPPKKTFPKPFPPRCGNGINFQRAAGGAHLASTRRTGHRPASIGPQPDFRLLVVAVSLVTVTPHLPFPPIPASSLRTHPARPATVLAATRGAPCPASVLRVGNEPQPSAPPFPPASAHIAADATLCDTEREHRLGCLLSTQMGLGDVLENLGLFNLVARGTKYQGTLIFTLFMHISSHTMAMERRLHFEALNDPPECHLPRRHRPPRTGQLPTGESYFTESLLCDSAAHTGPRRSPNVHPPRPNSAPRAHDADALASVSLPSVSDMRALGYAHRRSAASASTSRFVECFEPHGAKGEPETPATATSFSTFASTSTSIQEYCLPLHVAWHDAAHTASPPSSGYPYIVGEHDEQVEDAAVYYSRKSYCQTEHWPTHKQGCTEILGIGAPGTRIHDSGLFGIIEVVTAAHANPIFTDVLRVCFAL
ncbi:hypothetical protein DFH09DRAFT_1380540 [Mycena vulgaris]|nr:hypothetical protein DFH09DRAFT_1380540 [Mycena vulgaris]